MANVNDNLVLISGESTTGKSASLEGLVNPEGVWYMNAEAGKKLPFKNCKFKQFTITDPYQVYEGFTEAEKDPNCHTLVVDTVTYLMDMFESVHVLTAANTMEAWSKYAQYFKNLMQIYVARSSKNVIMLAHTLAVHNQEEMTVEVKVPVKGSLKNQGIESFFSTVISTKRVPLSALESQSSSLLNITPKEELRGVKYVFQTDITADTINERIRGPIGMWSDQETFIDNNIQHVMNRLVEYYAEDAA